ncbi:hypothetical protein MPH_05946 [Macrophomina phaseolina MS6]|uniref:Zn(2)-C6 fungal-type domain-containing protein n=1 Tax=Macrophomina phaseolina (strain MS6) TaxID=1126212 RepID=K2RQ08_MACPH|nr:hypothetical protein MPH_05946 [Macrophomina phaseolina MS6]
MQQDNGQSSTLRLDSFHGEQACNECKRRKARCDKALPQCTPCAKNRRHCLYEKHSKTPLTRRYLTEVEERLRLAEIRAREAERRAQLAEQRLRSLPAFDSHTSASNNLAPEIRSHDTRPAASPPVFLPPDTTLADPPTQAPALGQDTDARGPQQGLEELSSGTDVDHGLTLEAPPNAYGDFSWDEQTPDTLVEDDDAQSVRASHADDERVVDGMASLTVEDADSGYLGNTSGAAMLRLLLPGAENRKTPRGDHRRQALAAENTAIMSSPSEAWVPTPLWNTLRSMNIDLDAMIDAYFKLFHVSYPLVHEPTFRAQYAQVIPRPHGSSWNALAYMIATIGAYTDTSIPASVHKTLFNAAKSNVSIHSLETGNLTLVRCLALMHNYLQKMNKPNSGYNYLGLALHMAMGLGLHKEFHGWDISPLEMEGRRRVWWCLFSFSIGAHITFGRPLAWPQNGVDVALPLNVDDRDLTNLSRTPPSEVERSTIYSAVIVQSKFHLATNQIYSRVILAPAPSAGELLRLDELHIGGWASSTPAWYQEDAEVPEKFRLSHRIMWGRVRNFRIIMYRPYVIRRALLARSKVPRKESPEVEVAYERCLLEAKLTISMVSKFWCESAPTRVGAWYMLYFLFQASLIPCVCLRNEPTAPQAMDWREQIRTVLGTCRSMIATNPSAQDCYDVILRLCRPFIQEPRSDVAPITAFPGSPTRESPQSQINSIYPMMWPSNTNEIDLVMNDGAWTDVLGDLADPMAAGTPIGNVEDFQWT